MSYLKKELGENYKNLDKVLEPYLSALDDLDINLAIKGKLLEHSNREQASWLSYYDQRRIELSTLVRFFEQEVKRIRGILFKQFVESYPRDLSDRQIDKYIDSEQAYLDINEKYLAIKEVYDQFTGAVDAFIQRGYALRNITNIRVNNLEDVII